MKKGEMTVPGSGWISDGKRLGVVIGGPNGEMMLNGENELKSGVPNPGVTAVVNPAPKTGGGGGNAKNPAVETKPDVTRGCTAITVGRMPPPIRPIRVAWPVEVSMVKSLEKPWPAF